jgi:hypothetical protein
MKKNEFGKNEIDMFLHEEAGKQLDILYEIKKIYLDWFNSDADQVSKHTADVVYKIGEELKKIDSQIKTSECLYDKEILIPLSEEDLQDLNEWKEFHWEFEGVKVHIKQQEEGEDEYD